MTKSQPYSNIPPNFDLCDLNHKAIARILVHNTSSHHFAKRDENPEITGCTRLDSHRAVSVATMSNSLQAAQQQAAQCM